MAGIVLAGGRSGRMGRDKVLVRVGGVTLLELAASSLKAAGLAVVVVAPPEREYPLPAGCAAVPDDFPGEGPLGGLITGLRAAGPGVHVALACDMPSVRPALIRRLLACAEGHDAAVPAPHGRPEPLCAAYHAVCLAVLESQFAAGERSVRRALDHLRVRLLTERELRSVDPQLDSFRNINTPADLAAL